MSVNAIVHPQNAKHEFAGMAAKHVGVRRDFVGGRVRAHAYASHPKHIDGIGLVVLVVFVIDDGVLVEEVVLQVVLGDRRLV